MRRLKQVRSYRVEVAPAVWRELGAVPGDHFKRMRAELENVAQLVSLSGGAHGPKPPVHRLRVDDHEGVYEIDADRGVVRLLSVYRAPRIA